MIASDRPLHGRVCMVTGATSGIGAAAALALARRGATVIVVARDPERGAATIDRIAQETGNRSLELLVADLSSQADVRRLAGAVRARTRVLHALVNNAGGLFLRREESVDGIEMTLALNHLSPFLLTNLLLDVLRAGAPARIVNVSSDAHRNATIAFDDLQGRRRYSGLRAYGQSKLANVLFAYELARRLEGTGVTANAVHPGFVATGFASNNGRLVRLAMRALHVFARSPEEGARTVVYLASPDAEGATGAYFVRERPVPSSPESYDRVVAARLWRVSEDLTGLAAGA